MSDNLQKEKENLVNYMYDTFTGIVELFQRVDFLEKVEEHDLDDGFGIDLEFQDFESEVEEKRKRKAKAELVNDLIKAIAEDGDSEPAFELDTIPVGLLDWSIMGFLFGGYEKIRSNEISYKEAYEEAVAVISEVSESSGLESSTKAKAESFLKKQKDFEENLFISQDQVAILNKVIKKRTKELIKEMEKMEEMEG